MIHFYLDNIKIVNWIKIKMIVNNKTKTLANKMLVVTEDAAYLIIKS